VYPLALVWAVRLGLASRVARVVPLLHDDRRRLRDARRLPDPRCNPAANRSLIWFAVWSSIIHGAIMGVQSLAGPEHIGHLLGDVPALLLAAIVLGALNWADERATAQSPAHA
jgi:hypothetical protein